MKTFKEFDKHFESVAQKLDRVVIDKNDEKDLRDFEEDLTTSEACWSGYKQVGMKKKGNKSVPNCVPENKEENK